LNRGEKLGVLCSRKDGKNSNVGTESLNSTLGAKLRSSRSMQGTVRRSREWSIGPVRPVTGVRFTMLRRRSGRRTKTVLRDRPETARFYARTLRRRGDISTYKLRTRTSQGVASKSNAIRGGGANNLPRVTFHLIGAVPDRYPKTGLFVGCAYLTSPGSRKGKATSSSKRPSKERDGQETAEGPRFPSSQRWDSCSEVIVEGSFCLI